MRRVRIPNPTLDNAEVTYLDSDYSSGTALTVVSTLGYADNYMAVVGEPGEEKTEAKDITGTTGDTQIDISGSLKFSHNKGTPVYKSVWESASIERRTGSGGAWSEISVSELDWDKDETIYIDPAGSDSHQYRFRFYNQFLNQYSEYSPTVAGSGFTRKQVGRMIQNVRKITGEKTNENVTDTEILRYLSDAQTIIQNIRDNWWFLKVDTWKAGNGIATTASTMRYSLSTYSDLNFLARIRFNYNDGSDNTLYDLEPKDEIEFDALVKDQDRDDDDRVTKFKLLPPDSSSDQGYFEVYPTPENAGNGTFYPVYFKEMTTLDSVDDITDVPIPSILEDYAISEVHTNLGNDVKAELYEGKFYGPAPKEKEFEKLTGIALLEQQQKSKAEATGLPKSLVRFRGRKALRRIYERQTFDRDFYAEKYW